MRLSRVLRVTRQLDDRPSSSSKRKDGPEAWLIEAGFGIWQPTVIDQHAGALLDEGQQTHELVPLGLYLDEQVEVGDSSDQVACAEIVLVAIEGRVEGDAHDTGRF